MIHPLAPHCDVFFLYKSMRILCSQFKKKFACCRRMDIKMQLLLKEHRAAIIQDVDVDDIIDSLISSGTVAEEDFDIIRSLVSATR